MKGWQGTAAKYCLNTKKLRALMNISRESKLMPKRHRQQEYFQKKPLNLGKDSVFVTVFVIAPMHCFTLS
jgi:hypothetical protein